MPKDLINYFLRYSKWLFWCLLSNRQKLIKNNLKLLLRAPALPLIYILHFKWQWINFILQFYFISVFWRAPCMQLLGQELIQARNCFCHWINSNHVIVLSSSLGSKYLSSQKLRGNVKKPIMCRIKASLSLTYAAKANAALRIYFFDSNGVFYGCTIRLYNVTYINMCLLYFAL